MNKNEEYVVVIEKLINEGSSLGRINNIPVFIDGGCPGDEVKITVNSINKNYIKASIKEIIKPSEHRIKPDCSFHNICGSCNWQHIKYEEQLVQKQNIVKETLSKIAGVEYNIEQIIPSPLTKEYRCKVQLPVSETKVSKRILSGYYKKNSHELINIKYCHMHPNIINEINEFIKHTAQELCISAYDEKKHKGLLRHIIYRISSDLKNILIIFVINSDKTENIIKKLAEKLVKKYSNIVGICANYNTNKTNVIMSNNTAKITGDNYYIETLGNIKFKISANSFFQVNPKCAEAIFNKVKELISSNISNPTILDAYSGVSSFGIWLSDIASKVVSIEEVKSASIDAEDNAKLNNISNIEIINGDAAVEFEKLIKNNIKFDVSLIDPPRKGSSEEALKSLIKLTSKHIIYVSCNPATLARDMKILSENSFEPIYIQPVDMFPNTYHIETIVMLKNNKKEAI